MHRDSVPGYDLEASILVLNIATHFLLVQQYTHLCSSRHCSYSSVAVTEERLYSAQLGTTETVLPSRS